MNRSYTGMEFQPDNVIKKILLTGAKFHVNSLDAFEVIKSFFFIKKVACTLLVRSKGLQHHYSNFFQDIVNLCFMGESSWCLKR